MLGYHPTGETIFLRECWNWQTAPTMLGVMVAIVIHGVRVRIPPLSPSFVNAAWQYESKDPAGRCSFGHALG